MRALSLFGVLSVTVATPPLSSTVTTDDELAARLVSAPVLLRRTQRRTAAENIVARKRDREGKGREQGRLRETVNWCAMQTSVSQQSQYRDTV